MKMLSLFSGVGMIDLAASWAGTETVALCEIEPYAVSILERRFPNVPIYNDVRTLTAAKLREDGIEKVDIIFSSLLFSSLNLKKESKEKKT